MKKLKNVFCGCLCFFNRGEQEDRELKRENAMTGREFVKIIKKMSREHDIKELKDSLNWVNNNKDKNKRNSI